MYIETKKELVAAIEQLAGIRDQIEALETEAQSVEFSIISAVKTLMPDLKKVDRESRFISGARVVSIQETSLGLDKILLYTLGTETQLVAE